MSNVIKGGFGDDDDLEIPDWTPKRDGFVSREAKPRRRGRAPQKVQLNLRATPDTIDIFHSLADDADLSLADTFEKMVLLIKEKGWG